MATDSKTVAVAAIDKERKQALASMLPATREVAKAFEERLSRGAQGMVMINYDLGAHVKEVTENEGKYGSGAVELLAKYLQVSGGASTLYQMQQFAASFDRDYVKDVMTKPVAGGRPMTSGHWFLLSRIESKQKQKEMVKAVLEKGWSTNDLERELKSVKQKNPRSGGRKPGVPTSPVAGLVKTHGILQQWANWEKVAAKHVFDEIDEVTPDKVNQDMIKKIGDTLKAAEKAQEALHDAIKRLKANKQRAETVLEEKYKQSEKNRQELEGEAPAKKGGAGKKAAPAVKRPRPAAAAA